MFFKKIKNMFFPKKANFNQTRETIYCFKVHVFIQLNKKKKMMHFCSVFVGGAITNVNSIPFHFCCDLLGHNVSTNYGYKITRHGHTLSEGVHI